MNATMLLLSGVAVFAGTLFPIQTAVNARLAAGIGGPILSTLISFVAGLTALTIIVVATTHHYPDWQTVRRMPPWIFVLGGLLGATYLCLNVYLVPRIGSGAMMALAIAGQMLSALVLESNGALGLAVRDLTAGRLIGAALVVSGAAMVRLL